MLHTLSPTTAPVSLSQSFQMGAGNYGFSDQDFATLSKIATQLGKYNFCVPFNGGVFYHANYIASVAKFIATAITSLEHAGKDSAFVRWLGGELPIHYNPMIELSPADSITLVRSGLLCMKGSDAGVLALEFNTVVENLKRGSLARHFE